MKAATTSNARVKLALIPLLVLILIYVLTSSRAADDASATTELVDAPPPAAPVSASPTVDTASPPAAATESAVTVVLPPPKDWPAMPLEEILQNNPFAWPDELAPKALQSDTAVAGSGGESPQDATRQELLDQLTAAGVSAYYESGQGVVALVGTRLLRVGDVIDGQIRVLRIEPEQVTYEPVAP